MKACSKHWQMLRAAIEERGLSHLVAKDGHAAMEPMVLQLEGREREAMFDPLMSAYWMIVSAATARVGLSLYAGGDEQCPVCVGVAWNLAKQAALGADPDYNGGNPTTEADEERYWIDGPANAQRVIAEEKGLVQPPSGDGGKDG